MPRNDPFVPWHAEPFQNPCFHDMPQHAQTMPRHDMKNLKNKNIKNLNSKLLGSCPLRWILFPFYNDKRSNVTIGVLLNINLIFKNKIYKSGPSCRGMVLTCWGMSSIAFNLTNITYCGMLLSGFYMQMSHAAAQENHAATYCSRIFVWSLHMLWHDENVSWYEPYFLLWSIFLIFLSPN